MIAAEFKKLPVKQQLILVILTVSFTSLFVASTTFVLYDRHFYKQHLVHEMTRSARMLASHSTVAVERGAMELVEKSLETLGQDANIESACIWSSANDKMVMYSRHALKSRIETGVIAGVECLVNEPFISRVLGKNLDIIEPILAADGRKVGLLHLRVSLHDLERRIRAFSVVMLLIVLVVAMLAVAITSKAQAFISKPILDLASTVNTINRFKDYSLRARSDRQDEIGQLVQAFNAMLDTIELQNRALLHANENLEDEVSRRTDELRVANHELESFTYSVSHDLRSPLRSVDGFSAALLEDYGSKLDTAGQDYIKRIRAASQRMGNLIDSLLHLSRVSRQGMKYRQVDLSELADEIVEGLAAVNPGRLVSFKSPETLMASGDPDLLRIVLENLLGNAWKYTGKTNNPAVELSGHERNGETVYSVSDNGAGFDMAYSDKLFGPFQRLHHDQEFEGLGVGLATVARIIHRHGGEIWAEGQVGKGATFYFTLSEGGSV
jgi:signal transduction histidine kinase